MIAPVSIAVSSALQVSIAATGALAQATTMPYYLASNFSGFSLSGPVQSTVPTLGSPTPRINGHGGIPSTPRSDISEAPGLLEDFTLWEDQEQSLSARVGYAIDSDPLAQAGIALLATSAIILTAGLARHRIRNFIQRTGDTLQTGREWARQRWQQVHLRFRKSPDLVNTRSLAPVPAPPSLQVAKRQGNDVNPEMIPGFIIETDAEGKLIKLGEGAMGVVYLAHLDEPPLKRYLEKHQVAIKVIKGSATDDAERRFLSEAAAMERIRHKNVIDIENSGTTKDGRLYIVMELVDNGTLESWKEAEREKLKTGPLEKGAMEDYAREVAELFIRIANGVAAIHDASDDKNEKISLIHRDLKPSNVFLTANGGHVTPKIADFGLAFPLPLLANTSGRVTQTGKIVGTPYFLAPEVLIFPIKWSEQSDVYALGVMLFYILTGCYPYYFQKGDVWQTFVTRVASLDVTQPDPRTDQQNLSDPMAAIVMKAMAKDPAARYQTAAQFHEDLEAFLKGESLVYAAISPLQQTAAAAGLGGGDSLAEEFFGSDT